MTIPGPANRHRQPLLRSQVAFGPFRLDRTNELLTCDGRTIRLRPKAFAMLAHLIPLPALS